jgi:hypothetical protein
MTNPVLVGQYLYDTEDRQTRYPEARRMQFATVEAVNFASLKSKKS